MTEITFKPRVAPRDAADTLVSVAVGAVQITVMFVLPALICYWLTRSSALSIGIGGCLYVAFSFYCVANLVISPSGIRLSRMFGRPKFIPWSAITFVREVQRPELIWHGWLWPLFPPREMTPSFTSLGHYRIQFGQRYIYFPPSDPEAFMASVNVYFGERA
jgi:hypothetical protein